LQKKLSFIFNDLWLMQDAFHFGDVLVDGVVDATFIVVSIDARIGVHLTHDGLTTTILNGGIISSSKIIVVSSFDNVFMGYTSMD
jgi:hypothetical protein